MQRHRHDDAAIRDEIVVGATHPASHPSADVESVAVLQPVDKLAGNIVVGGDRTAAVERRGIGNRLRRQRPRPQIIAERRAEARAIRLLDQAKLRPARRA